VIGLSQCIPSKSFFHFITPIPGRFLGGEARPARKADNLTAICEPIV
jgi:hypothetical protein